MKTNLLFALLLISHLGFAQFPVGSRNVTYTDPARNNRSVPCEIYYPGVTAGSNADVAIGEFPIIIFGHGFAMQVGAYPNWREEFVPEGYIMVFPTTEGSFIAPNHGNFGGDLKFLVEKLRSEGQNVSSPFYQHVSARAAIMGHSMGGGATILGASGFSGVDCIVGLAPAETNPSAVAAGSAVSAPSLIISGSADGVTPPADHHIPIYDALGSSCKYFVSITEGSHCHYASNTVTCNLGELSPGSLGAEQQRQVTYAVCRPWFNYFLKDDCDAWDDFQTTLSTETDLGTINAVCANEAPVIVENNGTLESDNQSNYQWYVNGNEIPNADQQTFVYSQGGTYQVGTVNLGSCPVLSNSITVQITGLVEPEVMVTASLNGIVFLSNKTLYGVEFEWFDLSGRIIHTQSFGTVRANVSLTLDKPTHSGVKLMRMRSNGITKTWRLF